MAKGRQFVKGQSGNPNGRPRNELALSNIIRRLLAETVDGKTRAERVAQAIVTKAEEGDMIAIRELLDRVEGRLPMPVQSQLSGRVELNVKWDA